MSREIRNRPDTEEWALASRAHKRSIGDKPIFMWRGGRRRLQERTIYDARVTVIPSRRKSATTSSGVSASTMMPLTSDSGAMT